jgi:hypothetical protein
MAVLAFLAISAGVYAGVISGGNGQSNGPDVTIIDLSGTSNYTANGAASACPAGYTGTCRGYAVGTNSCNVGTVPVDWCDHVGGCRNTTDGYHPIVATTSDHSVIAQNLYRLKDGRLEQIGMSFLKHGFLSLNTSNTACEWNDHGEPNPSCVQPPAGGNQLGVGCSDFYSSGLNGNRPMGRRSDVQSGGGDHPPSAAGGETNDAYDQRIVVQEDDLDPAKNAGALYWVEGHYVVRDDARAGNGLNNASHRAATVGPMPNLHLTLTGPTVRELPAIFGWQEADPQVEIVQVNRVTSFTGEAADAPAGGETYPNYSVVERFHAARRVSLGTGGFGYHYEYAIYNLNSDTSADGFVVEFPGAASIGNVGFHDIDHHSGEPYDTSDWTIDIDGPNGTVTWSAVDAGDNTNALRWGTLYTFWFDSDSPPFDMAHSLDLFKIDELRNVPFVVLSASVFSDGFESGNTGRWTSTVSP